MIPNCLYCDEPCLLEQNLVTTHSHSVCNDERKNRIAMGKCGRCGKNDNRENCGTCSTCDDTNADYSGYTGPGQ